MGMSNRMPALDPGRGSGVTDRGGPACEQIAKGIAAVEEAANGGRPVQLLENGTDIAPRLDLSSFTRASRVARGPKAPRDEKGDFDQDLGTTAKDLERMVQNLLDTWK